MRKITWKSTLTEYEFETGWMEDEQFEKVKASLESSPDVYDIKVIEKSPS